MLHKAIIVISLLCSGSSLLARAQQIDNYVYVTDEINNGSFGDSKLSGRVERNFTINATRYHAYAEYNKSGKYISLPTDDDFGIVTTASQGFLKKIDVQWTNLGNGVAPVLEIYTQDFPFDTQEELYVDGVGACDTQIIQDKEVVNSEGLHVQSVELSEQARYFGLKPAGNFAHFRNLRVTWQLGYFCDEMQPDDTRAVCLPYDIAPGDFHGITAYSLVGKIVEGNKAVRLVFEKTSSISAGVPCLIRVHEPGAYAMYIGDKANKAGSANGMYGVLSDSSVEEDAFVVVDNKVVHASRGEAISTNKAYIVLQEVPEWSSATITDDMITLEIEESNQMGETPTFVEKEGIDDVSAHSQAFDIQGRIAKRHCQKILIKQDRKWLQR